MSAPFATIGTTKYVRPLLTASSSEVCLFMRQEACNWIIQRLLRGLLTMGTIYNQLLAFKPFANGIETLAQEKTIRPNVFYEARFVQILFDSLKTGPR